MKRGRFVLFLENDGIISFNSYQFEIQKSDGDMCIPLCLHRVCGTTGN